MSCSEGNFLFPVREKIFPELSGSLVCSPVSGSSLDLMLFNMVDTSSILVYHPMSRDSFFSVFDINTGQKNGSLCRRGNGPDEFQTVAGWNDIRGGNITMLNPITRRYYDLEISRSLEEGNLSYSRSCMIGLDPYERLFPHPLYVVDDEMIAYYSTVKSGAPYYAVYDLTDGEKLREYAIFKTPRKAKHYAQTRQPNLFMNTQTISPDRTKICMAMARFPQINIMDTKTGKTFGVRFRSMAEKNQEGLFYFRDVAADEEYIYALYEGKDSGEATNTYLCVFDWEGTPRTSIELDQCYYQNRINGGLMFLSADYMEDGRLYTLSLTRIKEMMQ